MSDAQPDQKLRMSACNPITLGSNSHQSNVPNRCLSSPVTGELLNVIAHARSTTGQHTEDTHSMIKVSPLLIPEHTQQPLELAFRTVLPGRHAIMTVLANMSQFGTATAGTYMLHCRPPSARLPA